MTDRSSRRSDPHFQASAAASSWFRQHSPVVGSGPVNDVKSPLHSYSPHLVPNSGVTWPAAAIDRLPERQRGAIERRPVDAEWPRPPPICRSFTADNAFSSYNPSAADPRLHSSPYYDPVRSHPCFCPSEAWHPILTEEHGTSVTSLTFGSPFLTSSPPEVSDRQKLFVVDSPQCDSIRIRKDSSVTVDFLYELILTRWSTYRIVATYWVLCSLCLRQTDFEIDWCPFQFFFWFRVYLSTSMTAPQKISPEADSSSSSSFIMCKVLQIRLKHKGKCLGE